MTRDWSRPAAYRIACPVCEGQGATVMDHPKTGTSTVVDCQICGNSGCVSVAELVDRLRKSQSLSDDRRVERDVLEDENRQLRAEYQALEIICAEKGDALAAFYAAGGVDEDCWATLKQQRDREAAEVARLQTSLANCVLFARKALESPVVPYRQEMLRKIVEEGDL